MSLITNKLRENPKQKPRYKVKIYKISGLKNGFTPRFVKGGSFFRLFKVPGEDRGGANQP